jgi:hypothetical protein
MNILLISHTTTDAESSRDIISIDQAVGGRGAYCRADIAGIIQVKGVGSACSSQIAAHAL